MRFKITLDLDIISKYDIAIATAKHLNQILGHNNKWHDMVVKPYTCCLLRGGDLEGNNINFSNKSAYFYLNTEDDEVIDKIISNPTISFDVENVKLFSSFNLLSFKKVIFNHNGKRIFVTDATKEAFINYVKNKYAVDIEILKMSTSLVTYKNQSKLPVTNLLVKAKGNTIQNLFESGVGGSTSIGFGFVELVNNK